MAPKKEFAQSAFLITLLTAAQKVLGLIREIVLARYYGTEPITDAFSMSISASEIVLGCITAFGVAFLPIYSASVKERGAEAGDKFMSSLLTVMIGIGTIVGASAVLLAPRIISLIAPGFSGATYTLTVLFFRIGIWSLLLQAIAAVLSGRMNYQEDYAFSTVSGLIVSPTQIAVIALSALTSELLLGTAVVFSNLCYVVVLYCFVRRLGYRYKPSLAAKMELKHVFQMVLPIFAGEVIAYINLSVDKIFASRLTSGSVSALNYAFNIRSLFIAVFTVVITTMVYPMLSKATAKQDFCEVRTVAATGIRCIILFFFPLTIAVVLLATPLLSLLYGGGAFQQQSLSMTSGALVFYCVGLPAVALRDFLTRVYYSLQRTKVMIAVWMTTMTANIAGDFLLVSVWGTNGLALATSVSVIVTFPVLYFPLRKMLHGLDSRENICVAIKSILASCVMGAFVQYAVSFLLPMLGHGKLALIVFFCGVACLGAGIYFLLLLLFHVREAAMLLALLRNKRSRR